jgi:hypothetical protein
VKDDDGAMSAPYIRGWGDGGGERRGARRGKISEKDESMTSSVPFPLITRKKFLNFIFLIPHIAFPHLHNTISLPE